MNIDKILKIIYNISEDKVYSKIYFSILKEDFNSALLEVDKQIINLKNEKSILLASQGIQDINLDFDYAVYKEIHNIINEHMLNKNGRRRVVR